MKKITERIISLILVFAIVLTVCSALTVSASEKKITQPSNFEEYEDWLEQEGYSVQRNTPIEFKAPSGKDWLLRKHFNFVTDEMVGEICEYIKEESGLDILGIITSVPETNQAVSFVVETFDIDTAAMREALYEIRFKMDEKGNQPMAVLFYFMGLYFSVMEECKAYCVPLDEENVYEIALDITLKDGTVETITTGVVFNSETGQAYGKSGNGILGTGYAFSIPEVLLYAQINAWTRDFGFCLFYDIFSYTTPFFFYETRRIKFDYDGLEWMVQIWKGNYFISNGAEIGIYSRDESSFGTYYDCATDEQMMKMSMELYHGDDLIFSRPGQLHWWLTGFKISYNLYPADSMTLKFSVEMKDKEMLDAFCNAVDKHYMRDMTYTVDGLTVNVVW
ncbi:MAG: DUF4474 domain-containing protein [Clostridia bacterium]|nr:DUF4474 domain-containing protein [Clostridia bacterium]